MNSIIYALYLLQLTKESLLIWDCWSRMQAKRMYEVILRRTPHVRVCSAPLMRWGLYYTTSFISEAPKWPVLFEDENYRHFRREDKFPEFWEMRGLPNFKPEEASGVNKGNMKKSAVHNCWPSSFALFLSKTRKENTSWVSFQCVWNIRYFIRNRIPFYTCTENSNLIFCHWCLISF
jgi:hypothetical protein